jgi:hypothetical protein
MESYDLYLLSIREAIVVRDDKDGLLPWAYKVIEGSLLLVSIIDDCMML